jgi:hypothetical protein
MTQVTFAWTIKIYELDGSLVCTMDKVVDQSLSFALNGIDTCSFGVYLDNTNAGELLTLRRVVKVWRSITDVDNGVAYSDPAGTPCFAGIITRAEKSGDNNMVNVLAQSPYWRLQGRFHRNNWKLVIDYAGQNLSHGWDGGNMDGAKWDVSALCWRLIDLVNHQLGATDKALTGIIKPTGSAPFWPKTLTIAAGRNVRRGNWVWDEIEEMLGQYEGGSPPPDLVPEYIDRGDYALMYFKTSPHRGTDKSATVSFDYCTGEMNLTDFVETEEIVPRQNFANFIWAVGNNNPETSRNPTPAWNLSTGDYSIDSISNYMYIIDSDSDDTKIGTGLLDRQAKNGLQKFNVRPVTYSITQSPLKPPYFGPHYGMGDLVNLNASKGALQVENVRRRVYEVGLNLSENCVETSSLRIAEDHFAKVPVTS